ncbi:MAG: cell division protein FtsZ [Candidatus Babeliales bacterium]
MIHFDAAEEQHPHVTIKVVGVGGAGGNTINSMIEADSPHSIEFIAINTDEQALHTSQAHTKIQIGLKSTKGLGTGANQELGKRAAEEDLDKIIDAIKDADIVFLTAGMGGGTGSGALPVITRSLKEHNILSIATITKPFLFEGKRRAQVAEDAIALMKDCVDTLIVIPNQKLLDVAEANLSMIDAFAMINNVLTQSIKGVSDIITKPGHINVDFADVRAIMKDKGLAVIGSGRASGENRAEQATLAAISSPLLETMDIDGAHDVLMNITGGTSLGLHEISTAASILYQKADEHAHIILGSVIDKTMEDEIIVTVIATGFDPHRQPSTHTSASLSKKHPETDANTTQTSVQPTCSTDSPEAADISQSLSNDSKPITTIASQSTSTLILNEEKNSYNCPLDVPSYLRKQKNDSTPTTQ